MRAVEEIGRAVRIGRQVVAPAAIACAMAAAPAAAQPAEQGELRGLKLGQQAAEMNTDKFGEFACGSNGSAPREPLSGWVDFARCRPEANGLHEVYVRYDDRAEYAARAAGDLALAERIGGTKIAGHPVILSVLFDDAGTAREIRYVTDPRAGLNERRMAHLLRLRVFERYGSQDWTCIDFPPDPGETPVANIFIKSRCEKLQAERRLVLQVRFFRKPGQTDVNPVTQDYQPGQFESSTRLEIIDPALPAGG